MEKNMYLTTYPMDSDFFLEIVGYDEYIKLGYSLKRIKEDN